CYPTQMSPATARVKFDRHGKAQVAVAAHEIGNGAYTVIGQMAAERLGITLDAVKVELGDTELPPGPVAGGSVTTASVCSAVMKACDAGSVRIQGGPMKEHTAFAFGAELVEVRIHELTREIRVPRIVGAFAAGHIMNPRTAHSQYLGAMIWGISSALHEETEIDRASARYVNDNIAEYLIPV